MSDTNTQNATVIYWRDIPTQIVFGRGRKAIKLQLTNRFMVAVDKAAMTIGHVDTDDYLQHWIKRTHPLSQCEPQQAVEQLAARLEELYPTARLADLARNGGTEPNNHQHQLKSGTQK